MDAKEALAQFNHWVMMGFSKSETPNTESIIFTVSAIKKQIPTKAKGVSWSHEGRVGNCPCCNRFISEKYTQGVCLCGQRVYWEVENDY